MKSRRRMHLEDLYDKVHEIYIEARRVGEDFDDGDLDISYGVRGLYLMLENDTRNACHALDLLLAREDDEIPEVEER